MGSTHAKLKHQLIKKPPSSATTQTLLGLTTRKRRPRMLSGMLSEDSSLNSTAKDAFDGYIYYEIIILFDMFVAKN